MRKLFASMLCLVCVCMLLPRYILPVNAAGGENSLTLHYYAINEALPLSNAEFSIYLVGEPDDNGGYTLHADFAEYAVDLSDLDWNEAGKLTALAITLSAYAVRDQIAPVKTAVTDATGDLTFDNLPDGLYLVWGDTLTVEVSDGIWNFTPQPLLLPLPYPDGIGGSISEMEVDVKYDRFPPPTMDDLVDLTVQKVWDGAGEHPDSVTVQLMRNGEITDSAELSAANNWQHTWKNLNSGYVWQIAEDNVPEGYTVAVTQEGYVFTIVNTGTETASTTVISTGATTTLTTMTTAGTAPAQITTTAEPSRLPQTGQLWWPVPILWCAGMICLGTGLIKRKSAH